MRNAVAATGLWATDLRGFPASQAHVGADCSALEQARCGCCGGVSHGGTEALRWAAARIHARCGGGDWFMSYGFRGFPASQAHMGAEGELPRGFMRDAEAATIFLCIE